MELTEDITSVIKHELSETFSIPFGDNGIGADENLVEIGMIDSFGLVELVAFLESKFSIRLSDEDLVSSDLTSLNGMARLVAKRRA